MDQLSKDYNDNRQELALTKALLESRTDFLLWLMNKKDIPVNDLMKEHEKSLEEE